MSFGSLIQFVYPAYRCLWVALVGISLFHEAVERKTAIGNKKLGHRRGGIGMILLLVLQTSSSKTRSVLDSCHGDAQDTEYASPSLSLFYK
jgi:hypothetical protein